LVGLHAKTANGISAVMIVMILIFNCRRKASS
jgi:hypothetical protein